MEGMRFIAILGMTWRDLVSLAVRSGLAHGHVRDKGFHSPAFGCTQRATSESESQAHSGETHTP
jgi:hypothetical protein